MTIEVNNIKIYYETINDTQLNKGHLKEHAVHITFINFSWPRIEKDDIIAIKVIGTALNKPNLPYIIFAKPTWTLTGCHLLALILFLKIDVFTSLIESGARSHILELSYIINYII